MTDIDRLIEVLSERALTVFARDEIGDEFRSRIREHINLSTREASTIQCVGMAEPISLLDLYQPTRIKQGATSVRDLPRARQNAVIYAGPGQGKTTLLHYLLLTEGEGSVVVPLFFTLRTEGGIDLLSELINILDTRRKLQRIPPKSDPILLLVDGYDEITDDQRRSVSDALNRYTAARVGTFMLTCRTAYVIYNIKAKEYELADFDRSDAIRFADAFALAMRIQTTLGGSALVKELEERKLNYIVGHPLMLTLACVVKSRTDPELPHNSIELLRQAMETLTFRWDESKRVQGRSTATRMLSIHIMQCTMQIAYEMNGLRVPRGEVLGIIARYLRFSRRSQLLPEQVLDDIRRFFGLITTPPDGYCQFVHKTIHDYLAARYTLENGLFQPARVTEWDLRAAYAASSLHDATQSLHCAFVNSRSIEAVRECLLNDARFDVELVASSVFSHFDAFHDYNYTYTQTEPKLSGARSVTVSCKCDFFDLADMAFLDAIVRKASQVRHTNGVDAVLALCMAEYWRRKLFVPRDAVPFVLKVFGSLDTVVAAGRSGNVDDFMLRTVIQAQDGEMA